MKVATPTAIYICPEPRDHRIIKIKQLYPIVPSIYPPVYPISVDFLLLKAILSVIRLKTANLGPLIAHFPIRIPDKV